MFRLFAFVSALLSALPLSAAPLAPLPQTSVQQLSAQLKVGDVVFIRVKPLPFRKVAEATSSWTNHVGIVVAASDKGPVVAESTFPLSRRTPLADFVARSESGRVQVSRLPGGLSPMEESAMLAAAEKRMGVFYDTGFNLHSKGQFCSRFVREVLAESTGITVGEAETFSHLLGQNPDVGLGFWQLWYFGRIPWQRVTVTPASILFSPSLEAVFNGYAA